MDGLIKSLNVPDTGIVVVCMQDYYMEVIDEFTRVKIIDAHKSLLNFAQEQEIPYFFANKRISEGERLIPELNQYVSLDDIQTRDACDNSIFEDEGLKKILFQRNINHLFLTGIYASQCIFDSLKNANKFGYLVSTGRPFITNTQLISVKDDKLRKYCKYYLE